MMRGFFTSFEGGEGVGKSTQITLLAGHLRDLGHDVVVTREPGGTKGAEVVRHILLSGAVEKYGTLIEALLFIAARADHVRQLIAPALEAGKIVLCDRFMDSTRVYQGLGEENEEYSSLIDSLNRAVIVDIVPDLTFILDLPAQIGLARANQRRAAGKDQDRFEKEVSGLHESRRQAFLKIAAQEPWRCVVVDGDRSLDVIACDIAAIIDEKLKNRQIDG